MLRGLAGNGNEVMHISANRDVHESHHKAEHMVINYNTVGRRSICRDIVSDILHAIGIGTNTSFIAFDSKLDVIYVSKLFGMTVGASMSDIMGLKNLTFLLNFCDKHYDMVDLAGEKIRMAQKTGIVQEFISVKRGCSVVFDCVAIPINGDSLRGGVVVEIVPRDHQAYEREIRRVAARGQVYDYQL